MPDIEKERRAAQHLLYVSLKYTKTCDVILNLIKRWQNMIEVCTEAMLQKLKKKRALSVIPTAPKPRVEALQKILKKEKVAMDVLDLYSFFRKIPSLKLMREHEFRKNVALRVIDGNTEINIDIPKLYEWQDLLENFIKFVRPYTS